MENVIIDSTVMRAHPAVGALAKNRGQAAQTLGCSRGGFSSKIHVNADGLGNALRFILTAGQAYDSTQVEALITDLEFERLIGDKSYDIERLLDYLANAASKRSFHHAANRKQWGYE